MEEVSMEHFTKSQKLLVESCTSLKGDYSCYQIALEKINNGQLSKELSRDLYALADRNDAYQILLEDFETIKEKLDPQFCMLLKEIFQAIMRSKEKALVQAWAPFKQAAMSYNTKKSHLLAEWLIKWSSYIQKEHFFESTSIKSYKQGEIILVDFGFRIGHEFGGRHYAVVLENNNNPRNQMILLVPVSSYDPQKKDLHPNNVDLELSVNPTKPCFAVMTQFGYYSKMRIERPLHSTDRTINFISKGKLEEIKSKIIKTINFFS